VNDSDSDLAADEIFDDSEYSSNSSEDKTVPAQLQVQRGYAVTQGKFPTDRMNGKKTLLQ
jgi:hypothetical protein